MQVIDRVKHLLEVEACITLRETSRIILQLNEGEQVALLDQLQHDEEDLNSPARLAHYKLAIAVPVHQVDDVWMPNVLKQPDLVVEDFLESRQRKPFHVVALDYLNRQKLASTLMLRQLDPVRIKETLG